MSTVLTAKVKQARQSQRLVTARAAQKQSCDEFRNLYGTKAGYNPTCPHKPYTELDTNNQTSKFVKTDPPVRKRLTLDLPRNIVCICTPA